MEPRAANPFTFVFSCFPRGLSFESRLTMTALAARDSARNGGRQWLLGPQLSSSLLDRRRRSLRTMIIQACNLRRPPPPPHGFLPRPAPAGQSQASPPTAAPLRPKSPPPPSLDGASHRSVAAHLGIIALIDPAPRSLSSMRRRVRPVVVLVREAGHAGEAGEGSGASGPTGAAAETGGGTSRGRRPGLQQSETSGTW